MKRTGTLALLLAVLILGLFATACGSASTDATPTPVSASGSSDTTPGASDSTPGSASGGGSGGGSGATTQTQDVKVGEAVDLGGFTLTLTSAKFDSGSLKALFTVDNSKGTGVANVRPTGFSATDADGQAMDDDIVCSTLVALVDAGKTQDGAQCWKSNGNEKTTGVKIQYDGGRSVGKILTWVLP